MEYKGLTTNFRDTLRFLIKYKLFYIMMIPGILYFILFHYIPMYGIIIAFKDYDIFKGVFASPWVGIDNFEKLFIQMFGFTRALKNTLIISSMNLLFVFPVPIILSLIINEVRSVKYKKLVQTSIYLPHFISWVVVAGMIYALLSPNRGIVRYLADIAGYDGKLISVYSKQYFRWLLIGSNIWKESGFSTIIYMAAITSLDQQQYEAAKIDGATKLQEIMHITLPGISSTIVILLILRVGQFLNVGMEQIYSLYNPIVYDVSEILDTYIYKLGIQQAVYDLATATGVFKAMVGMLLVLVTNYITKKIDPDYGLM